MKSILRYHVGDVDDDEGATSKFGSWCRWKDVEALQKELVEVRAQALAAVWLTQADTCIEELNNLREEAREVFMGADKQTIAKLQDRVAALEADLRQARFVSRSPGPGVTGVYGVKGDNDIRVVMQIIRLNRFENGGIEVEVRLP
jgi:hypothetical protein